MLTLKKSFSTAVYNFVYKGNHYTIKAIKNVGGDYYTSISVKLGSRIINGPFYLEVCYAFEKARNAKIWTDGISVRG